MSKIIAEEKINRSVIENIVEQKLIELIGDPDSGLKLRSEVKKRLFKSLLSREKGIPIEKLTRKLGLKW